MSKESDLITGLLNDIQWHRTQVSNLKDEVNHHENMMKRCYDSINLIQKEIIRKEKK